ncbi:unnamed protein product [Trichogramma brassicae]|uniref:Uncharacterized protein n=1 Tax=Trichogramma brassicae TaxID=86971 RepID=A0A6H5HRX8_9HYME|nr:unnamed protein product [Trichogramma brassicae]
MRAGIDSGLADLQSGGRRVSSGHEWRRRRHDRPGQCQQLPYDHQRCSLARDTCRAYRAPHASTGLYVVINLQERVDCASSEDHCPADGFLLYNSNWCSIAKAAWWRATASTIRSRGRHQRHRRARGRHLRHGLRRALRHLHLLRRAERGARHVVRARRSGARRRLHHALVQRAAVPRRQPALRRLVVRGRRQLPRGRLQRRSHVERRQRRLRRQTGPAQDLQSAQDQQRPERRRGAQARRPLPAARPGALQLRARLQAGRGVDHHGAVPAESHVDGGRAVQGLSGRVHDEAAGARGHVPYNDPLRSRTLLRLSSGAQLQQIHTDWWRSMAPATCQRLDGRHRGLRPHLVRRRQDRGLRRDPRPEQHQDRLPDELRLADNFSARQPVQVELLHAQHDGLSDSGADERQPRLRLSAERPQGVEPAHDNPYVIQASLVIPRGLPNAHDVSLYADKFTLYTVQAVHRAIT